MKWIDDQEDYFLRDFDAGKNNATGYTDNTGTGEASATPATSDTPANPGPSDAPYAAGPGGHSGSPAGEFTFPSRPGDPAADEAKARRRRRRRRLTWFFLIVFAIAAVAFYIRYFVPYASDTVTTGYITLVEKRGIFFKTFEGEMISESMLADTAKVYSRDVYFSIPDDSLGRVVQSYQGTGKRVTITTQRYFGTLPWRGSQKSVITDIRPAR